MDSVQDTENEVYHIQQKVSTNWREGRDCDSYQNSIRNNQKTQSYEQMIMQDGNDCMGPRRTLLMT